VQRCSGGVTVDHPRPQRPGDCLQTGRPWSMSNR
jgi:hypothetical protein